MIDLRRQAIRRLRRGDTLHMTICDSLKTYWFEDPYWEVDSAVMATIFNSRRLPFRLVGLGDSLFGTAEQSQSWKARHHVQRGIPAVCN